MFNSRGYSGCSVDGLCAQQVGCAVLLVRGRACAMYMRGELEWMPDDVKTLIVIDIFLYRARAQ